MLQRNRSIETDQKRKISLPAAIFNKSPSRGSENSSMMSNTNNFKGKTSLESSCFNHPAKKAKYRVLTQENQDDDEVVYCQKCAILLASRGFQVQKLNVEVSRCFVGQQNQIPRSQQLRNFIKELQIKLQHLNQAQKEAEQIYNTLQDKEDQQIQMVQDFFSSLSSLLNKKKTKLLHQCSLRNRALEEEIQEDISYIGEKKEIAQTMKEDIESSIESIARDTPEQDYQLVMQHYKKNLSDVRTCFTFQQNNLLELPSLQKIQESLNQFLMTDNAAFFSFDSSQTCR